MNEKYEINAKFLNSDDFIKKYDTIEEAQITYDRYNRFDNCYYLKLSKIIETELEIKDNSSKLVVVSYLDGIEYCEEEFISMDKAKDFAEYVATFCLRKNIEILGGE